MGSLDAPRGDESEEDERQDDEQAVKITAKETTPRENYNVDAFKDVDLDRLKAASLFHQEPPKSTEAAGTVMQPMVFAWKALSRRLHKAEISDHDLPKRARPYADGYAPALPFKTAPYGTPSVPPSYRKIRRPETNSSPSVTRLSTASTRRLSRAPPAAPPTSRPRQNSSSPRANSRQQRRRPSSHGTTRSQRTRPK